MKKTGLVLVYSLLIWFGIIMLGSAISQDLGSRAVQTFLNQHKGLILLGSLAASIVGTAFGVFPGTKSQSKRSQAASASRPVSRKTTGEYYAWCIKCNRDGSFRHVDRHCSKCCGTGKDWRKPSELDWYKEWVKGQGVGGKDLEIFYEAHPPTTNLFGDSIS